MKTVIIILILFSSQLSFAQDEKKISTEYPIVIQFSGIIVTGDSAFGVPHVLLYVPKTMRGTETNDIGYFTMPALAGDSLIIQHIGYKKQHIILPDGKDKQSYTYIIELKADTSELEEITVLPYPTFQLFKEAFAKVKLPKDENEQNWEKNLNKKNLERMMLAMAPSSLESYRTYTLQEVQRIEQRNMVATNPLTNPFAWISLIHELNIKRKQKKKEKAKDAEYSEF